MKNLIRKTLITAVGVLSFGAMAAPAMASTTGHHHRVSHVKVVPALANGSYNIVETSGCCAVGASSIAAGNPVVEVSGLGRTMFFTAQTSYFGDDAGWITFSNGNFMAANSACNGVTIKSDSSSTGTVWAAKFTGAAHTYWLVNRYCDQNGGSRDNVVLAGNSHLGDHFYVATQGFAGEYQKMTLAPA